MIGPHRTCRRSFRDLRCLLIFFVRSTDDFVADFSARTSFDTLADSAIILEIVKFDNGNSPYRLESFIFTPHFLWDPAEGRLHLNQRACLK